MTTRYVFRRITTVTVVMADPDEPAAREWAEQSLPLDDYAEDWVTVEHGEIELVSVASRRAARGTEAPRPDAARALAAQGSEEEHRQHPSGDWCVFCNSQWPCEESEEGER